MSAKDPYGAIDALDDKIHDLVMRRAELAAELGRAPALARAAQSLARLAARHRGDMPLEAMLRVWHELFAAMPVRRQTIHVYDGEQAALFHDLARDRFGSTPALVGHALATSIIQACADDSAAVGIVPPPESDENARAWWTQLAGAGQPGPRIIAKLAAPGEAAAGADRPWAYAIGSATHEPAGDDTTLLLLEAAADLSRGKLLTLLKQAGFDSHLLAVSTDSPRSALRQHLLETAGFVGHDDGRLGMLLETAGDAIIRVAPVGGFANPSSRPEPQT
jgi:hypothetical protein